MLNKAKRRASRVGFTTTKFVLSVDFIQLQLLNSEGLLPSGSLMTISLERGSKCVSTDEKLFRYEDKELNPLTKSKGGVGNATGNTATTSAMMLVNLLQRLELVATLYKEPGQVEFQEKDAIIKLRVTKKDKKHVFGGEPAVRTIGFHTMQLNHMIARLHAKKNLSSPGSSDGGSDVAYSLMEEEVFLPLQDMPTGCGLKVHIKLIPLKSMGNEDISFDYDDFMPDTLDPFADKALDIKSKSTGRKSSLFEKLTKSQDEQDELPSDYFENPASPNQTEKLAMLRRTLSMTSPDIAMGVDGKPVRRSSILQHSRRGGSLQSMPTEGPSPNITPFASTENMTGHAAGDGHSPMPPTPITSLDAIFKAIDEKIPDILQVNDEDVASSDDDDESAGDDPMALLSSASAKAKRSLQIPSMTSMTDTDLPTPSTMENFQYQSSPGTETRRKWIKACLGLAMQEIRRQREALERLTKQGEDSKAPRPDLMLKIEELEEEIHRLDIAFQEKVLALESTNMLVFELQGKANYGAEKAALAKERERLYTDLLSQYQTKCEEHEETHRQFAQLEDKYHLIETKYKQQIERLQHQLQGSEEKLVGYQDSVTKQLQVSQQRTLDLQSQWQEQLATWQQREKALSLQLSEEIQSNADLMTSLQKVQQDKEGAWHQQLEQAQVKIQQLQGSIESSQVEAKALKAEVKSLQTTLEATQDELKSRQFEIGALQVEAELLRKEIQAAQQHQEADNFQKGQLQQQIKFAEELVKSLQVESKQSTTEQGQQILSLQQANQTLKLKVEEEIEGNRTKEQEKVRLQDELVAVKDAKTKVEGEHEAVKNTLKLLQEKHGQLEHQKITLEQEKVALVQEKTTLKEEKTALEQVVEELRKQPVVPAPQVVEEVVGAQHVANDVSTTSPEASASLPLSPQEQQQITKLKLQIAYLATALSAESEQVAKLTMQYQGSLMKFETLQQESLMKTMMIPEKTTMSMDVLSRYEEDRVVLEEELMGQKKLVEELTLQVVSMAEEKTLLQEQVFVQEQQIVNLTDQLSLLADELTRAIREANDERKRAESTTSTTSPLLVNAASPSPQANAGKSSFFSFRRTSQGGTNNGTPPPKGNKLKTVHEDDDDGNDEFDILKSQNMRLSVIVNLLTPDASDDEDDDANAAGRVARNMLLDAAAAANMTSEEEALVDNNKPFTKAAKPVAEANKPSASNKSVPAAAAPPAENSALPPKPVKVKDPNAVRLPATMEEQLKTLRKYKIVIKRLAKERQEFKQYLKDAAEKLSEANIRRAEMDWMVQATRAESDEYKYISEQLLEELQSERIKRRALKEKMSKYAEQFTQMEVQYCLLTSGGGGGGGRTASTDSVNNPLPTLQRTNSRFGSFSFSKGSNALDSDVNGGVAASDEITDATAAISVREILLTVEEQDAEDETRDQEKVTLEQRVRQISMTTMEAASPGGTLQAKKSFHVRPSSSGTSSGNN